MLPRQNVKSFQSFLLNKIKCLPGNYTKLSTYVENRCFEQSFNTKHRTLNYRFIVAKCRLSLEISTLFAHHGRRWTRKTGIIIVFTSSFGFAYSVPGPRSTSAFEVRFARTNSTRPLEIISQLNYKFNFKFVINANEIIDSAHLTPVLNEFVLNRWPSQ